MPARVISGMPLSASSWKGQHLLLAVLREHQLAFTDLGESPAVIEHGARLVTGAGRGYDVRTDAEPNCLQLRQRERAPLVHRHFRDQHQPTAIALVEPALDRLPGFVLAPC